MSKRSRRTASTAWRTTQPAAPVQVTRLHPLITDYLGVIDLRRVKVLRTHEDYAVDIILGNSAPTQTTVSSRVRHLTRRAA